MKTNTTTKRMKKSKLNSTHIVSRTRCQASSNSSNPMTKTLADKSNHHQINQNISLQINRINLIRNMMWRTRLAKNPRVWCNHQSVVPKMERTLWYEMNSRTSMLTSNQTHITIKVQTYQNPWTRMNHITTMKRMENTNTMMKKMIMINNNMKLSSRRNHSISI